MNPGEAFLIEYQRELSDFVKEGFYREKDEWLQEPGRSVPRSEFNGRLEFSIDRHF